MYRAADSTSEEKVERIKRKLGNENSLKQPGMSIMNDRRVFRGSNYSRVAAQKGGVMIDPAQVQMEREVQRRKLKRANQARGVSGEEDRRGTPEPVANRRHMDIQTDQYYEKLTEIVREHDAETQTPFAYERPPSPLFIPAKSGSDAGTQILDGELFDFDREVIPVLEVVVGRTIERALMEVLEEEELKAIQKRQAEFAALRHAELLEAQRMEGVEKRRSDERERRKAQEQMRLRVEGVVRRKVLSRQLAKQLVAELEADAFKRLQELGKFDNPHLIEVETKIFPQILGLVAEEVALRDASASATAKLIERACTNRMKKLAESRDKSFARKAVIEGIMAAAEKESKVISDIEQLEATRISEERERMKSWEAGEDPPTPPPEPAEEGNAEEEAAGDGSSAEAPDEAA
ncbi:Radial spoke head protein 3 [Perkinsus olseni]|uniref:Radial spoke head protein 3 n=1 Tax=Perkinsus olseni TaxID=32597 RepID=A0A7J6L1F6_PEROL|nr:Radial spoke head protein 3 [Perkinsus olseni]